jgi:hypothetical protein
VATTIERLSEQALLVTIDTDLTEGQNLKDMIQTLSAELNAQLDRAERPQTVLVQDAHQTRLNFSILIEALDLTTARGANAFFAHPNIDQVIFVTRNNLARITATILSQPQYGSLKASVAPTLEEALTMLDA